MEEFENQEHTEQTAPVTEHKKTGRSARRLLVFLLAVVLVVGSSGTTSFLMARYMGTKLVQADAQYQEKLADLEERLAKQERVSGTVGQGVVLPEGASPAQVYAANSAGVVLIKCQVAGSMYSSGGVSSGSGFILTEDGYVVTNYHVVEGGTKLTVVMSDNKEYDAKLIGSDNANDVALLKVEAENLPALTLGDSDLLTVGDQVVAIGNPLGELTSTLTVGYVSAKERDVNTSGFAINMIQTDAAINSGNSGGPLFNMAGQVVGITTAKYSGSSSSGATIEGIGFAIPINDVRGLLEDLATYGYAKGPYLGLSVSDMDAEAADYFGMPVGVYVNDVVEGYCAQKAGLQPKDIILELGGHAVTSVNELSQALRKFEVGQSVEVKISRAGTEMVLTVVLDERPQEEPMQSIPQETEPANGGWSGGLFPDFG